MSPSFNISINSCSEAEKDFRDDEDVVEDDVVDDCVAEEEEEEDEDLGFGGTAGGFDDDICLKSINISISYVLFLYRCDSSSLLIGRVFLVSPSSVFVCLVLLGRQTSCTKYFLRCRVFATTITGMRK